VDWKKTRLQTRALHAGEPRPRIGGSLSIPIFQSVVFEHLTEDTAYDDILYPRLNNLPNHVALGRKLAALEGGEAGLVTASGMAAITTTLLETLGAGGHLLVQDQLYGGTHAFLVESLSSFGLSFDFVDAGDPRSWADKLRPTTRAFYVESMTNPLMQVAEHQAVASFAREHGLVSIIDNTFATPVNFRPLEIGFDLVVHSATKYLNGHSDLVAGAIVGSGERIHRIRHHLNHLGGTLDPHACFLLNRGLKTLVLRVQRHNENGLTLARALAERPEVACVHYPGLEDHPHHARAEKLFDGFGGMLSFEPAGGVAAARRIIGRLRIPTHGPSLGGVETLVTRPATTSHAGLGREERERLGIGDALIRVSVGVEAIDDLMQDFLGALADGSETP